METPPIDPARLPELYEAVYQLRGPLEGSDVIQHVLESTLKLMKAEHAFLWLDNSHAVHIAPSPTKNLEPFFSSISKALGDQMAQAHASIYVSDWQEFSTFANEHLPTFLASQTIVMASLKTTRGMAGTLAAIRNVSVGAFTSEEASTLEFFGKWVVLALDNARISQIRESCASFVQAACFDIRSPIATIVGLSELLMNELTPVARGEQIEWLRWLNKEAKKVSTLTNVLPDVAQIEFDSLRLMLKPVDIAEEISKIVKELSSQLESKGHAVEIVAPAMIPLVRADLWRFHQILTGLIDNADKFMLQAGRIAITTAIEDGFVRVSVTDTGIGIQLNEQSKVFSKWFRANLPVELRHLQGVGTSLYIFRHIVEGMGGTIGFESVPDKGSTFWFTLPIAGPGDIA